MKVILDTAGCDNSPEIILQGVKDALDDRKDLNVVLSGDTDLLTPVIAKLGIDSSRIEILDAKEVITNDDVPTVAMRKKKNSSLVVAIDALKNRDDIDGMVSAGSTGAVLTTAIFGLGRMKGVLRPALAPVLPTLDGKEVCLIDCGANVDCKKEYLVQFALMGISYMRAVYGVENPRVALVSLGVEDKKGNELTKSVFEELKKLPINFVGNMEARDALSGDYDVLVCDGFVGNVLLKSTEGAAGMVMKSLKRAVMNSTSAKIGALFMKKAFRRLKSEMDYQAKGGAPLLGVEKLLVKGHGASNASAVRASILQVCRMAEGGLIEKIRANLELVNG